MTRDSDYAYEGVRRITYGDGGEYDGATFVPVCSGVDGRGGCGRFVKADASVFVDSSELRNAKGTKVTLTGLKQQPNATCARCGRVMMAFEGFV